MESQQKDRVSDAQQDYVFEAFESIPRLSRACVISEKIDGTNAQVFIPDGLSCIRAGSRNRWISVDDDNHGFARWVEDNKTELMKLGPGRHYGEWWGAGIQRRYDLKEKRFSLFNSGRWTDDVRPACCHVAPVLYSGIFTTGVVEEALAKLARDGSAASPGFMKPEGVVVYLAAARKLFKKTIGYDGHKGDAFASRQPSQVAS
jgi:RNA ligase-like protein